MASPFNLLVILGTTASGKTKLAVEIAQQLNGEIISADSRQVYKGLDIGSGKDLEEYQNVPYHLIDIVSPGHEYNIFEFQQDFTQAFQQIQQNNKLPILAGGSALYVDAVLKGYRLIEVPENNDLRQELSAYSLDQLVKRLIAAKPQQHNTTDILERERIIRAIEIAEGEKSAAAKLPEFPSITPFIVGIDWQRDQVKKRITTRLKQRLDSGMIDEVKHLHKQGVSWETLHFYGLEYRFIAQYLQEQLTYNDMYQKLNSAIHQFAKKQMTWLRRLEKNGTHIHWIDGTKDTFSLAMAAIAKETK